LDLVHFSAIKGLGYSATAQAYAIQSLEEACAYLKHPVLGPRLVECTRIVNAIEGRDVSEIFGYPDDLKFRSSMTLFSRVSNDNRVFEESTAEVFRRCT